QWWRLVTCLFLHAGIQHLVLNMGALYVFGQFVERLYGNGSFLILYLTAGMAGSVASAVWRSPPWSVGASSAILGIYGGLLAYLLVPKTSIPPLVRKSFRKSTLVVVAYSVFMGLVHAHTDNAAHLGGLAGGFLMGLVLARPRRTAAKTKVAVVVG